MPIKLLDNSLINKIAAGEVVERPSSVVKELVENAVDAGATEIAIEIENGGKSLIKISDNGSGIKHDELELAFSRHATSKIATLTDLENIGSLGFRGEALSSISSVSNVEVITKTASDELAKSLELSQGEVVSEKFVNRSQGTTFIIRDLFFNVPVRLKFLKKNNIESSAVTEIVTNLVLSNPNVAFTFINNGQTLLRSDGDGNLNKVLQTIAGSDLRNNLLTVNFENDEIQITGAVSNLNVNRSTRKNEYLFINSRYVKNKMITDLIESFYTEHFQSKNYPVFALNLKLNPQNVDVNVHPTKLEVRFVDESGVFDAFTKAMKQTFEEMGKDLINEKIPSVDFKLDKNNDIRLTEQKQAVQEKPKVIELEQIKLTDYNLEKILNEIDIERNNNLENEVVYGNKTTVNKEKQILNDVAVELPIESTTEKPTFNTGESIASFLYTPNKVDTQKEIEKHNEFYNMDFGNITFGKTESMAKANETKTLEPKSVFVDKKGEVKFTELNKPKQEVKKHDYKVVGQVFGTYWLLEKGDEIFFFDQHAGHEIFLYYKFLEDFKNSKVYSQILLEPKIITLDFKQNEFLISNLEMFKEFGYDIEVFDDNIYTLKSVPIIFDEPSSVLFFLEIINELVELDRSVENIYELQTEKLMMMSCRSAVKANDKLTEIESREIIDKVLSDEKLLKCPHGRPTLIKLSKKDIEKMFKRI